MPNCVYMITKHIACVNLHLVLHTTDAEKNRNSDKTLTFIYIILSINCVLFGFVIHVTKYSCLLYIPVFINKTTIAKVL